MKIINVDGTEYHIPESWEEINLKQFVQFMDLLNGGANENYTVLYQISAFCNIDLERVKRMNPKFLPEFLDTLSFLQTEPKLEPIHKFEHNGETYSIVDHILNGQSQDFLSLMAVENDNKKTPWRGLSKKIAILAKRKLANGSTETLDDYDAIERSNHFMTLPVTIVKSIDSFFLLASMMSSLDSNSYLKSQNELIHQYLHSIINSLSQLDGRHWFGLLQMKILRRFILYIKNRWEKYYTGIMLKPKKIN